MARFRSATVISTLRHSCRAAVSSLILRQMLWTLALPGADIASLPVGSVVASNAVSEELEGFLRAPQASGLFLVDRELQPFHEPLDRRQHVRRRGLAEHTESSSGGELHPSATRLNVYVRSKRGRAPRRGVGAGATIGSCG